MKKTDQRGTLLVEAIAMLGLIAMVTPTLYKKSAERLQEIQDINIATQARMMGGVIDTFIRSNLSAIKDVTSSAVGNVVELCQDDHTSGCFTFGYSSAIPSGFQPDDLRGFEAPKIYVRNDENKLVYYILYPKHNEIGKRRAARLASLVGANGGFVDSPRLVQGVGGAWELDSTMIDTMRLDASSLVENSLVVTAPEPIVATIDDSDKYLYRVPDNENPYHNTMVTDLYLGGHQDGPDSAYSANANDFYSIFNVRKLTLNTKCRYGDIKNSSSTNCLPDDVADLYIGKPDEKFSDETSHSGSPRTFGGNKGAAWIYGNLSALSDRFKVFHTEYQGEDNYSGFGRNGYDVLRFARTDTSDGDVWDESSTVDLDVLRATNENGSAEVGMMNGFVRVVEEHEKDGASVGFAFLVGSTLADGTDEDGSLIEAYDDRVNINNAAGYTRINPNGGWVYINGSSSGASAAVAGETYINQGGGLLWAGRDGGWFTASGEPSSANVHILNGGSDGSTGTEREFIVGTNNDDKHMIFANEDKVSLRGGNVVVYDTIKEQAGSSTSHSIGAGEDTGLDVSSGTTVIASRITDIYGGTYMGVKANMTAPGDGVTYERSTGDGNLNHWTLGVAGSAWVDDLLYARQAWFSDAGFKDLHAGFSSFADYSSYPERGWLNVYGGNDGRVVVRDPNKAHGSSSNISDSSGADTMFYADSTYTYIGDTVGSYAAFQDGVAYIGTKPLGGGVDDRNYFTADSSSARMVGSTLAQIYTARTGVDDYVDIQKGAMLFRGHSWNGDDRSTHTYDDNTIEAHANQFRIHTKEIADATGESAAVFYADADDIRTRYVDFSVEDDSSLARFKVMPNEDPEATTGSANVMVNGSFHVTGNKVIHIASNSSNAAGVDDDNPHAVFEVDPRFVKVMARDSAGNFDVLAQGTGDGESAGKLAILKINPDDISGGQSVSADTNDASVYIRRGAIELEESASGSSGTGYAADEGFGYIKANRLVSNTDLRAPVAPGGTGGEESGHYDQFMVNPAYTSVMHDIKLTTRGGARLSDILPDYILKGVYNVSNDYIEQSESVRISWSAGDSCNKNGVTCVERDVDWANTYVGIIPYAICPRGYKNLATIVPISFRMGQAGEVIKADQLYAGVGMPNKSIKYVVNPSSRQTRHVLSVANANTHDIVYPWLQEASSYIYNDMYTSDSTHSGFDPQTYGRTEGWFWGLDAIYDGTHIGATTNSRLYVESSGTASAYHYEEGSMPGSQGRNGIVAEPLYFQQNTFLKTALAPGGSHGGISGWKGRMGFLYDRNDFVGGSFDNTGIASNNNDGDNESSVTSLPGNWIWNLFPVATNSIEGHATVYCYFDRTQFTDDWSSYVDQIDQLDSTKFRPITDDASKKPDSAYKTRLNDPSLKYSDPW